MEVGIVGLPVSGKTTLFATLTGQAVESFRSSGKIEVHRGIVKVPDRRLDRLTELFNCRKKVNATIEYIEIGGLEGERSQFKGFDVQFLQVLKNTDALCVVIRAFENEFHPHPAGSVNIQRDIQTVESEFLLSDLSIVENRIERLEKQLKKAKDEKDHRELELLKRCQHQLEMENALREQEFTDEEKTMLRGFQFLTAKPLVLVINIEEKDIADDAKVVSEIAQRPQRTAIALSAKVEEEISELPDEDRGVFLEELNIKEAALPKLIRTCFDLLGLISFFTMNEEECRAWNISHNTPASKAAGAIHSDMERGFIRAEVVHYDDFVKLGSLAKCREKGILRLEGKNYIVKDGDIVNIRFNI